MESKEKRDHALEEDERWYEIIAGADVTADKSALSREARAVREAILTRHGQELPMDMNAEWYALRNRLRSEGLLGSSGEAWWKWRWPWQHPWALGLIAAGVAAVAIMVPYAHDVLFVPQETEISRGSASILIQAPDVSAEADRIVKLLVDAKIPIQRRPRDGGVELEFDMPRSPPPAIQSIFSENGVEVHGGQKAFILVTPQMK